MTREERITEIRNKLETAADAIEDAAKLLRDVDGYVKSANAFHEEAEDLRFEIHSLNYI